MAKKRKSQRKQEPQIARPRWMWGVVAVAVLLLGGGLVMLWPSSQQAGTPKVVVEQTVVDEGYQTYSTRVRSAFRISNAGDGPLTILGAPEVRLVEGC